MTTFASDLPDLKPIRSSVLGKRLTLGDPLVEPPPLDTPEVAEPSTGDQLDTFIHQNRLVTPKAALEARKVPRSSIAELNQTDADEIRTRLLAMGNRDTRSPAMKALDLLDAPRNVIMSLLNSDLRRKAEAEGDTGTFGLGRVNFSDVLRSLGVNNRVAAGILGFTGDVLFDPLTYVGPAGWGAKVGVQAGGKVSTVGLRAVGKRLLDKQIAHVASGGAGVLDEAAHGYLAAKAAQKGFASPQEWFTSLAGQGLKPSAIRDDIARTVYGDPSKSLLERVFRPLGGERSFERAAPKDAEIGNFAHDFFNSASATDPASMAARKFVEKYGEGTGAALRFGRAKGATGSQILHVPFLSQYTVQTGPFTAGATRALGNLKLAQRAQDAVHGLTGAASGVLEGIGDAHAALEQTILSNREAKAAESEAHAALMAQLPDEPPPPPSSPDLPGGGPIGPQPPSPSPIVPGMEGGLELPPNAPERTSNYIIDSAAATPEPRPEQGRIAFDVDARAQEILDNGDALDLEDARGMAQIEADAAARAQQNIPPTTDTAGGLNTTTPSPTAGGLPGAGATGDANVLEEGRQEGREGLLSPPDSSTTTPPAAQPAAGGFADPFSDPRVFVGQQSWYRGTRAGQGSDTFWTTDKSVAGDYGHVGKMVGHRPKNPAVFQDKQEAADAIGLGVDDVLASDIHIHRNVDERISTAMRSKGYDSILYVNGTMGQPELHVLSSSHRERVLGEARSAFSDRPSEELDAFAALVDARAKAMVKSGKIKHGDELWSSFSIAKGADGKPNVLYQPALHGSPHRFGIDEHGNVINPKAFSLSAIGSGEGAQAYTRGLYFTQADDVQRHYRNLGMRDRYLLDGQLVDGKTLAQRVRNLAESYMSSSDATDVQRRISSALQRGGVSSALETAESAHLGKYFDHWSSDAIGANPDLFKLAHERHRWDRPAFADLAADVKASPLASTGDAEIDAAIRATLPEFKPDSSSDPLVHLLRGLEDPPRETNVSLRPRDGIRRLRDMPVEDQRSLDELESRMHWARGSTPAEKLESIKGDLRKTVDVQAGWKARYEREWSERFGGTPRVLTQAETNKIVDDIEKAILGTLGASNELADDLDKVIRDLSYWNEVSGYVNGNLLADGSIRTQAIEDMLKRNLGESDAAKVIASEAWSVVESGLSRPSAYHYWDEAASIQKKAQSALDVADKYDIQAVKLVKPGVTYKVELAPTDEDLVWWDKPISENPAKVQQAVMDMYPIDPNNWEEGKMGAADGRHFLRWDGPSGIGVVGIVTPELNGMWAAHSGTKMPNAGNLIGYFESLDDAKRSVAARAHEAVDEYLSTTKAGSWLKALERERGVMAPPEELLKRDVRGVKYLDGMSRSNGEGTYNFVIYDDKDVTITDALLQQQGGTPRGSIRWEDGHAVIRALKAPNVSTLFHETGHLFLPTLDTAEHAAIAKVYKVDAALLTMTSADAKKTPALFRKWAAAHERWANDFERYLASGKAPTPELQSVFEKLKQWFTDLYKKIIGTPLEKELSPEIRKVMDRMLGGVDDGGGLAVPAGKVTRSTIWDRLEKSVEDTRDIIRAQEESIEHGDELIGGRVGITNIAGATTFRSIPTELKMALQRPGGESLRRRFIRVVGQTRLKAGGEDAVVSEFGGDYEKYVDWLEGLAGSERAKVLRAAELSEKLGANPSAPFWRELWEAWPVKGRKADIAPMDALDVVKAGPDVAFTFHGKPLHTTLDEDGTLVVVFDTPSRSGMTVPVELVGEMPVDPGSVRRLSEDEIAAMQGVDDTNLYQRDVAGQEGLFGSRVGKIGDGREQASLFGPAPEEPKPIPVGEPERMLNESDDAYKARVAQHRKWAESARNTGTLFQGGPDPMLPGPEWKSPRQLEEERWTERAAQLDAEHRDALDQVRALRDRALKSLEAFDPETAVPNDATLNDVLRLGELKDRADHLLALEAHRSNWVDLSNKLDAADDPAFRTEELGDRLYNLAKSDPKAADSILEAIHGRMEALNAYAQSVQATIQSVADGPERDLAELAKHVLGTDDDSMAMALFAAPARFIRDRFGENTAAYRYADATERFWRRTFGVRRGSKTQVFADLKGELTTRPISEKLHAMHRMEQRVEAMRLPIPKADAMNLLHAYIYRETTDDARGLGPFVWKISEDGRNAGDSEMVEMLKRAQDSGALTPEHIALLKQNAKEFLAENRRIGFAEQDAGILGLLRPDYVSSPLTAEAQRAARAHKQAGNIGGAPSKGWPTPAFARARTTDQVRFPMAAENLGESSDRWHRFFVGDMALADAADESLTPIQLRAKQAVVEYFKAVETDPSFAVKYSPRPSDPLELNALEKEGRFQHLTGGAPLEEMKETDLATIYGLRMGQHQHAMAMRNLGDMIVRDGFQIDPELFAKSGQRPGAEGRLRGGTKVTVVTGLKSNLGNPVDGVKIGDTLYRRLDTSLWSAGDNVLGNMLSGLHTSGGAPVNMKSMLLHHAQADAIEDLLRLGEPSRFDELLRTADTLTGMWKMVTLTRPSWIVFNMLGDTANALARGADPRTLTDVARGRQLWQVYKNRHAPEALKDLVVTLRDGREMTGIEFWNDVVNSRVVDNTLSSEAMLKIVENNPGLLATADRKMRSFVAPWFRINQAQQDWMRMMVFSSFLDQGHDTSVAAKRVLESIGDYADFTKTEERYFRRTFPFYSWMRNNLGYQIMQLGQRPSYAALMPKLQAALQEVAAGEAVVPENLRPGWMRDQLATQIGTDPNSRFSIMLGNALPTGDLTQALAGAFGTEGAMKFLHYFTSNLNPVATIPLQIGTGTEFFSGRSIGPDSYTGDMSVRQFAVDQATGPLAEAGKVVKAFGRGTGQGVARALLGGRVQAFDQPRLDSSVRREFREAEQRIRGAVSRAQRDGDEETSKQARTRLMQLYADAMRRGLDDIVPAWAEEQLAEMGEAG